MAWRPTNAGPKTIRELYHWVHKQLRDVGDELEGGGGGGEANTSSNVGGGNELALPKVGVDLPFRTLLPGSGITMEQGPQTITINSLGGGGADQFNIDGGRADSVYDPQPFIDGGPA